MSDTILSSLISAIIGGGIVALVNQWFTRMREIESFEREKIQKEIDKLRTTYESILEKYYSLSTGSVYEGKEYWKIESEIKSKSVLYGSEEVISTIKRISKSGDKSDGVLELLAEKMSTHIKSLNSKIK